MNSTAAGSTLWQTIFVSFAIVLLLFEIVRGYRLGLPRQLMRGAAVIAAYAAAYFGGRLMLPLLRPVLKWPDFIVSMIGGALLAIVVYGVMPASARSFSNEPLNIRLAPSGSFTVSAARSPGSFRFIFHLADSRRYQVGGFDCRRAGPGASACRGEQTRSGVA